VDGPAIKNHVDVLNEYNAVNDPDIEPSAGWWPTLYGQLHPTPAVPALVWHNAGPFNSR
jgi:hypothetical protein